MGKKTNKDTKKSNKDDEEYYDADEVDFEYDPADFEGAQYLEEDEYNVEEIVDMKIENGKKLYLIKWDGYPHSQNTWEPADHLTKVLYMVEQFEEEYAKNKSLMNMERENPRYFGEDDKLVKTFNDMKKKKNRDLNDEQEIILKKRKVNPNDDYETKEDRRNKSNKDTVKESKPSTKDSKASVKGKVAPPPEEDLIQEITMYKEDLTESKKKKEKRLKSLSKADVEEDTNDWLNPVETLLLPEVDKSVKETKTVPEVKPTISDPQPKEPKENKQQAPTAPPKETPKETPKQVIKEVLREVPKEVSKEVPREVPKEVIKEVSKEVPKETPKETPKEYLKVFKEVLKEVSKEVPQETHKEISKEVPKEVPKEAPKQVSKEVPKEIHKETPKRVEQVPEKAKEIVDIVFTKATKEPEMVLENIEPAEPKEVKPAVFVVNREVARKRSAEIAKKAREKNIKVAPRKKDKTGGFRNKDRPKAILSIKHGKDGGLVFLVEWHNRIDGTIPENSYVTNEDMKLNDPYFLIDFYESKLITINKKEEKRKAKEKAARLNGAVELEPMHTENEPVMINNLGEAEVQQPEKLLENVIRHKPSEPKSIKSPVSLQDFAEGKESKASIKSKQANKEIIESLEDIVNNNKDNPGVQNTQMIEEPAGQSRMEVESNQRTPVFKGGETEENKSKSGLFEIFLKPKEGPAIKESAAADLVEKMVVEEQPQEQDEEDKEARKSLNKNGGTEKESADNNGEKGNLVSVGS